jgi:hypothetical protein
MSTSIHTDFIPEFFDRRTESKQCGVPDSAIAAVLAALAHSQKKKAGTNRSAANGSSDWLREGRSRLLR